MYKGITAIGSNFLNVKCHRTWLTGRGSY